MSKRKLEAKKSKREKKSAKKAESSTDSVEANKYGGIPSRDLKKNLGCG